MSCIFLSVKPRSYGHFPSPTPSVSPRGIFNKTHLLSMSTAAVMPFRSFVQTPIFSVSPSSFSLQRI